MPPRSTRSSCYLSPETLTFLSARGGRPDRGRGPLNQSNVLRRHLDFYADCLENSDPRQTSAFPEPYYGLTLELLDNPWSIRAQDIETLDVYLVRLRTFPDVARRRGVDTSDYARAVAALSYTERLFVVNAAEIFHARPSIEP
jgi:hypothetical protein